MKILETIDLFAGYKKARNIIRDIDITIEEGEFVGLFGTNGAGKSTVLKAIMGLLYQQEGKIVYYHDNYHQGLDIIKYPTHQRSLMNIKYLTQDAQIFPRFSVKENLMFVLNYNTPLFNKRSPDIFALFPDLGEILNKRGELLSGGQREKLAISMVLITIPKLLMLDEPSAGLSPNVVESLLKGLRTFQKKQDSPMAVILIEQQKLFEAKNICDSIYLLKNGNTVDLEGTPSHEKLKTQAVTDEKLEEFMLISG